MRRSVLRCVVILRRPAWAAPAVALSASLIAAWSGCVHYRAQPINPDAMASAFAARSLADDGLRRYLAASLGHEPSPWPPEAWDLDALTGAALYFQPSLEVARAQWAVARAAIQTASAHPNPVLTVTPGYDTSVGPGISPWFPSVQLDWPLATAGKRGYQAAAARFAAEAARLDILSAAWEVRSALRRALIEAEAAERRQAFFDEEAAAALQSETLARQRFDAGAISAFEVSTARSARIRAEAAAAEARRQAPESRSQVAQILGLPLAALAGVRFSDVLGPPPAGMSADNLAAARRVALSSRSDILAALARYEVSQAELQLEIARQYPDLHLGPGYQYDLGENKWSLALGIELPIFHHNQGPIAEAEARRRTAAAQFMSAQARAIAEIDRAAAAQTVAVAQLARLRSVQAEVQAQAARMRDRVAAGEADRLELQNARTELAAAGRAVVDAEVGAAEAAGQLEDALQVPSSILSAAVDLPPAARQPVQP